MPMIQIQHGYHRCLAISVPPAFYDMYDSIEMALIEAEVMTMLEEPEWQDKDGNHVEFEFRSFFRPSTCY